MTIIVEILIALVFAILLTVVLSAGFGRKGPWSSIVTFFLVVFLATWTLGIWFVPFGPIVFGVAWVPFLIGALVVALILSASVPPGARPGAPEGTDRPGRVPPSERKGRFDAFFVILLVGLAAALVVGYVIRGVA